MNSLSRSIVIADGHELTGSLVEAALRRGGFLDIHRVSSGSEALDLLKQSSPSLLILDLDLPGVDGVQLLTLVRRLKAPKPCCLVLTSFSTGFADRLKEIGASAVMAKPFDPTELCLCVEELLSAQKGLVLDVAAFEGEESETLSIEVRASRIGRDPSQEVPN